MIIFFSFALLAKGYVFGNDVVHNHSHLTFMDKRGKGNPPSEFFLKPGIGQRIETVCTKST